MSPPPRPEIELPPPPEALVRFERIFFGGYFRLAHNVDVVFRGSWPERGPLIVTSNHPSFFDPWLVGMGIRRYIYWMAWDQLWSWPAVGRLVAAHHALPVDLDHPKPSTLRRARAVLDAGHALGVFPEGERTSPASDMDAWKPGLAALALGSDAKVLPVSIRGRAWPKGSTLPRPGRKLTVTYHPLVDPAAILPDAPRRERAAALTDELERITRSAL